MHDDGTIGYLGMRGDIGRGGLDQFGKFVIASQNRIAQNRLPLFFRHIHNACNPVFIFLFDDIDTGFAVPAADEEDFILCSGHVDLFTLSVKLSTSLSVPKNQPLPQRPASRPCL